MTPWPQPVLTMNGVKIYVIYQHHLGIHFDDEKESWLDYDYSLFEPGHLRLHTSLQWDMKFEISRPYNCQLMFFVNHNLFRPTTKEASFNTKCIHRKMMISVGLNLTKTWRVINSVDFFQILALCACVTDGFLVLWAPSGLEVLILVQTSALFESWRWFKVRLVSLYDYGNQKGTPRIVRQKHWTCRTITSYFQRNHGFWLVP